jgi:hypothetical protein
MRMRTNGAQKRRAMRTGIARPRFGTLVSADCRSCLTNRKSRMSQKNPTTQSYHSSPRIRSFRPCLSASWTNPSGHPASHPASRPAYCLRCRSFRLSFQSCQCLRRPGCRDRYDPTVRHFPTNQTSSRSRLSCWACSRYCDRDRCSACCPTNCSTSRSYHCSDCPGDPP